MLRVHTGKWTSPEQANGIRLLIDGDGDLDPFGVEFGIDIEELQDDLVSFALKDIIATILLELHEAAGIGFICAAIEGPDGLLIGFSDLFPNVGGVEILAERGLSSS